MKALQAAQSCAINLSRRSAALIAKFAWGVLKGSLGVAKAVTAIGSRELAIDKNSCASFSRAGADVVGGEYSGDCGGNDESFRFGEETKRNAHRLLLRSEQRRFAVERINEDPAQSRGGKREKMSAAHVRSVTEESTCGANAEAPPDPCYK